jgi:hypothetical protein
MGRGRAKAKQTKVARELKYQTPKTDLDALQRELAGDAKNNHHLNDPYASYLGDTDEDDEESRRSSRR